MIIIIINNNNPEIPRYDSNTLNFYLTSIVTIAHEMYRIFVNFRCISLILVMNYLEKKNLFVSAKDEIEAPFSKLRGPKITMTPRNNYLSCGAV